MALELAQRRTRRSLLAGALGAVAGAAAATLTRAHAVLAAGDDTRTIHVGDNFTDVRSDTSLFNQATDANVLTLRTQGAGTVVDSTSVAGIAVKASSYGTANGVEAYSGSGTGVYGRSFGTGVFGRGLDATSSAVVGAVTTSKFDAEPAPIPGVAVYGVTNVSSGRGVHGAVTSTSAENYGVLGTSQSPLGRAVFGWSLNETDGGTGVWGQTGSGTGAAIRGYAWDGYGKSGRFGTGVIGTSGSHAFPPPKPLPNTGVYGIGRGGRGVVAKGDKAQLRLIPSSAATHPSSGLAGDLFVDKSNRLWFCRGGTIWKQISLA